jgi:class 3 adenylate cyclase
MVALKCRRLSPEAARSRSGQLKVLWCVADVWHQALGERPVCHSCGSPVDGSDAYAEYKQVTVLFADVVHSMDIASVVGAERLREIMAALVDRAAVVVQRYEGDGIMAVLGGRP